MENINNNKICTFYIKTTGKNTFFTIHMYSIESKYNNIVLQINSCGHFGFKGRKKETPFACSIIANKNTLYALKKGFEYVNLIFNGVSVYKKIILSTILKTSYKNKYIKVLSITDNTQIPHNGCRAKKIKKR